jgi:hypothetical protein
MLWPTSLAMLLGGAGESSYIFDDNPDNIVDNHPREKNTQTKCYIYARRDTVDGLLEIIKPQGSMWYCFNVYIYGDAKLQQAFRNRFCLPYKQYLKLVE